MMLFRDRIETVLVDIVRYYRCNSLPVATPSRLFENQSRGANSCKWRRRMFDDDGIAGRIALFVSSQRRCITTRPGGLTLQYLTGGVFPSHPLRIRSAVAVRTTCQGTAGPGFLHQSPDGTAGLQELVLDNLPPLSVIYGPPLASRKDQLRRHGQCWLNRGIVALALGTADSPVPRPKPAGNPAAQQHPARQHRPSTTHLSGAQEEGIVPVAIGPKNEAL
ncbi:hypothetical protein QBC34DRAFT_424157 [Podospora aff. communis PSN243]|uniref:Uncharacterized protein n=1 Tax=Podospora aff. communis PSN243 TaxID=3040156 RepID=A0AAV9GRN3_9PEZI|nr:hypothetical protein QBC34DRAFT_424157 [Podospora aff. communis PSN243]